jgi:hypothetical protein
LKGLHQRNLFLVNGGAFGRSSLLNQGLFFVLRHFSLQYFTTSQSFSHFLRQENGFLQITQILLGK